MVPRGAAKFRGGPLRPMAFLLVPTSRALPNTRRFETSETMVIGGWMRKGDNERIEGAKSAKNGGFQGENAFYWRPARFRGVPLRPYAHSPSHRPYIRSASEYQAFRNHRNVGYWERGKGENERTQSA